MNAINVNSAEFKALHAKAEQFNKKNRGAFEDFNLSMDDAKDVALVGGSLNRITLEMNGIETYGKTDKEIVQASVAINRAKKKGVSQKQMLSMDDTSLYRVTDLDHFDVKDYMIQYQNLDLVDNFAKMPGLSPGMTSTSYQMTDMTGAWKVAGQAANDIPVLDVSGEEFTNKVTFEYASIVYNAQEIDHARYAGLPLEVRKIKALRRGYSEFIQDRILSGHTGIEGLFTSKVDENTVPSATAAGAATGDQWLSDLRLARNYVFTQTKGRYGKPGTIDFKLYIGQATHGYMTTTEIKTTYSTQTVWSWLNSDQGKAETGIKAIVIVPEFDDGLFASGTKDGWILGIDSFTDPDIVEFAQPLEMQMQPIQYVDLQYKVIAKSYTGGLIWRYPKSWVRYKYA